MASEYFKWLARDVRPEEQKELTREEKWRNWWYYHKWYVIIGVICLLFVGDMIYDAIHNARNQPDYQIAYVGTAALPDDTIDALETAFAQLGEDLNGNGEVRVVLTEYLLLDSDATQQGMSSSMLLLMDIESAKSVIFLLEDPESFAAAYPVLEQSGDTPAWYRWGDCPVLARMDLPLEDIAIARRGFWNGEQSDTIDGALELFDALTAGAA